jgi:hypothetical protein
MRAKVISVVLVACGVFGAAAVASPSAFASRGGGDGGGHDNGQQGNTYDHSCTANDRHVIGNVCVIVNDLPVLGNILTS